jgi:SAM-dependent methyltransferase
VSNLFRLPMEEYNGRHCGCAPGTHAGLVAMIQRHVSARAGVLDLGAHAGALLARLQDAGFKDLQGTDLDLTRFDLPGAYIRHLDLNTHFSAVFERKFRLISCTDVIEHLDSPRQFLHEVCQLLEDDGYVAISFPNVAFWEGRLKFLLKGELWGFGRRNYQDQRHISPMTFDQFILTMEEVGLALVACGTAGSFATLLRKTLLLPFWAPLRLIGGPRCLGESAIFLARKAAPNAELLAPHHYRETWKMSAKIKAFESEQSASGGEQ